MKMAWLFPVNQKCGISYYSYEYIKALADSADVEIFDISECLATLHSSAKKLNSFDGIHIQYETSFFMKGDNKYYQKLCSLIQKPLIVSLHEVYESFPGIFPRSQIKGAGIIRAYKEFLYDMRHPFQTTYTLHESEGFFADLLVVHGQFQKEILINHGVPEEKIFVIPMPIKVQDPNFDLPKPPAKELNLASLGFINQNFMYPLLFDILDNLEIPWHFTWIGGIRRDEDKHLLDTIEREISRRHWQDRFTITGWVSENELNRRLSRVDIYLALFSQRSSSASLATALGARKIIIATKLPMTQEIVKNRPIMKLVPPDFSSFNRVIHQLSSDESLKKTCLTEIDGYIRSHTYHKMANRLVTLYRKLDL